MVKVKFNREFRDLEKKKTIKANAEVEMTLKRAEEAVKNVREKADKQKRFEDWKDFDFERVDKPKEGKK